MMTLIIIDNGNNGNDVDDGDGGDSDNDGWRRRRL